MRDSRLTETERFGGGDMGAFFSSAFFSSAFFIFSSAFF
jgi:hypothetical protein